MIVRGAVTPCREGVTDWLDDAANGRDGAAGGRAKF